MSSYEYQLRHTVTALFREATLEQRDAQIKGLAALLSLANVAILLQELDDTRSKAITALDIAAGELAKNPLAPEIWGAVTGARDDLFHAHRVAQFGTTHSAPPGPPLVIPGDVHYAPDARRFYQTSTGKDMGYDFWRLWHGRVDEFPKAQP